MSSMMSRGVLGAMMALSLTLAASTAGAAPSTDVATALRRDVSAARAADLRPFLATSAIVENAPAADARSRSHKAPLALTFARLGRPGVMPMLELVVFGAPTGVPAATWPRVRRDMVEALGVIRDARALPALLAILDDGAEDAATIGAAAEAVARIGTSDAEGRLLAALASSSGERERAILSGLGERRTTRVVSALAERVRATKDEATARVGIRSLGRAGNAWAWTTEADKTAALQVREDAARALVDAFVRWDGEARTAASNALMVVDAAGTPARIAEAKGAHPELAAQLDALAARFAKNPTRTR